MTKVIKVWTAQMAKYRKATALGLDLLDITAKSGIQAFAPLMENVMRYKRGELSEKEYTELYYARMRRTYLEQTEEWRKLKNHDTLVLLCYCPAGAFCHRHLFRDILTKYLKANEIEIEDMGEIE